MTTHNNLQNRQFLLANQQVPAWLNAWALIGDYLSAAAFLGAAGMYFNSGFDSFYYAVATLLGWPLLLILFAPKLRQDQVYTLSDILNKHFQSNRLRLLSATTSLGINIFYLLVQLVGAGKLLQLLFNLPYLASLTIICILTLMLVLLGGMKATTWVQAVKAVLLFACALTLVFLIWQHFDYTFVHLWQQADKLSQSKAFQPSQALQNPIEQISLLLGLVLGLLGLPHVLMRFYTVKNSCAATLSAAWATALIALFFICNLFIGYGAYVIFAEQTLSGGSNMVLLHLATFLAGDIFKWIISWMVLITVLAVMSGLVLAASASLSHDLLPKVHSIKEVHTTLHTKICIVLLLILAATLAALFEQFNLAFLFGLAFAWAASAHFPVLFLRFFYPAYTEKGAFYTLLSGAISSLLLIVASPTVWVKILGFQSALFPYHNPTLFSLPLALICGILFSLGKTDKTKKQKIPY